MHKKCQIGDSREGTKDHIQFPRDENGKYDPNGTYTETKKEHGVELKTKYEEEKHQSYGAEEVINCVL